MFTFPAQTGWTLPGPVARRLGQRLLTSPALRLLGALARSGLVGSDRLLYARTGDGYIILAVYGSDQPRAGQRDRRPDATAQIDVAGRRPARVQVIPVDGPEGAWLRRIVSEHNPQWLDSYQLCACQRGRDN